MNPSSKPPMTRAEADKLYAEIEKKRAPATNMDLSPIINELKEKINYWHLFCPPLLTPSIDSYKAALSILQAAQQSNPSSTEPKCQHCDWEKVCLKMINQHLPSESDALTACFSLLCTVMENVILPEHLGEMAQRLAAQLVDRFSNPSSTEPK